MKLGLRQIFAVVPALFLAMSAPAQELPKMPSDPAVSAGVLPNGMSYYIAVNASEKGLADFALVQKTGMSNVPDSSVAGDYARTVARDALSSLARLGGTSPQTFFSRHGSVPEKDGYVTVSEDATMYRFHNVRLSDSKAVLDSALMIMLDIADRGGFTADEYRRKWYSPADQAIVVAGDVDAKALLQRLEAMSYMIPSLASRPRKDVYAPDSSRVSMADVPGEVPLREITMTWVSKRVPREYMNTVQPVIFEMALDVLGKVAVRRLRSALAEQNVAAADVSYYHRKSQDGLYDDAFILSCAVYPDDVSVASSLMSGVMSAIDDSGASLHEYLLAEADFVDARRREVSSGAAANDVHLRRCISSFLYNSWLSSSDQLYAFHTSRNIPDSVRCGFFNEVASALISPMAGHAVDTAVAPVPAAYPLNLPEKGGKVKIRSVKTDHLSGGSIWTFSNGFKVVYRYMPSAKEVCYTLALNGGYGSISGLSSGEGAFISDMFGISRIAGVKGKDFFEALRMDGVVMEPVVTLSNVLVEGHLPKDRIPLLLQALLALANTRTDMQEAFPYYKESVEAELAHPGNSYSARMTAIDSIMCPGYRFSPYKSKSRLTSSFYTKAGTFLDAQMSKMNDGVLVIVGNLDEEVLKAQLMQFVGGFRTSDVSARRPVLRYQTVSGWSTYMVKGERDAVDVAVSARMPMTSMNYLAANIAMMAIERDLTETLADSGVTFDIRFNCRIYPEERMNMLVSVSGVDVMGLSSGMEECSAIDVLGAVRSALSGLSFKDITDDELKQYKAYLKNRMEVDMKDPVYWVNAITVRYLDGKDFTTGYSANIDALSKADVKRIFTLIDKGCKVEYVTAH